MGVSEKRLISIMPSYLLVCFIWPFAYPDSIKDWVLLLPVDLLGVQTAYRTLFGILHNGGAWFVSCMLMCYVAYPVIKSILGSLKKYVPLVIVIVLYTLLVYNNIVIPKYALDSTYSNPIIRTAEFMIGVAFAEIVFRERQNADRAFMKNLGGGGGSPYGLFCFWLSYQFFLAQLFLWKITGGLLEVLGISGNMVKISVSLICCIFISFIVWYFYDRPVRKILYKKMIEVIKDI